jgi:3-hydroxyacyl-CoA dehydrogenase
MYYADEVGLGALLERLQRYRVQVGAEYFTPAALIERLVREGRGFYGG